MAVGLLLGPLLLGAFLNTMLYGVLLVQAFSYYRNYRNDATWMRYFVLFLVIVDTLNTVCVVGAIYEPLIIRFGTSQATELIPVFLYVDPVTVAIGSTAVQCFMIWRIKIITNSKILPPLLLFLSFAALVGGIATTTSNIIFKEFSKLSEFQGAFITWLAASAVTDICITSTLVWSLKKRRRFSAASRANDYIDRINRLTVQNGAITAFFAMMCWIFFYVDKNSTLNFIFDFGLGKLYTNSLLSTLNARGGWSTPAMQDNVLFGLPSNREESTNTNRNLVNLNVQDRRTGTDTENQICITKTIEVTTDYSQSGFDTETMK